MSLISSLLSAALLAQVGPSHPVHGGQSDEWHNMAVQSARLGGGRAWTATFSGGSGLTPFVLTIRGLVLITCGRTITAIRERDGKKLWQSKAPFEVADVGDHVADDPKWVGPVLVLRWTRTSRDDSLFGMDPGTGRTLWSTKSPVRLGNAQVVGKDLACEIWTKSQDQHGSYTDPILDRFEILDSATGKVAFRLSATDEAANRALILKHCPDMLDEPILFGDRCAVNGIYRGPQVTSLFSPESWIVGDGLYSYFSIEDYYEFGDRSGLCGLQKRSLSRIIDGDANSEDLWQGMAMGRDLRHAPSASFGPVLGLVDGRLLTSWTTSSVVGGQLSSQSSLVTLPLDGPPSAVHVLDVEGGAGLIRGGRLSVGFVLVTVRASQSRLALLRRGKLHVQPVPEAEGSVRPADWLYYAACPDGVVYQAFERHTDDSWALRVHLEPFSVSKG